MFSGTQQKCKVCTKTVYPMDQLCTDGDVFHRSCFKSTLSLSNYSSFDEGVPYGKAHFELLFKETGSYNKSFQSQSPAKTTPEKLAPELTRSPSKAARMFSGTQDKCATCGKTAYPLEKELAKEVHAAAAGVAHTRCTQETGTVCAFWLFVLVFGAVARVYLGAKSFW